MKRALHIVLVLLVAAACRGPRVIPKDTLTDIYVDMLMADQLIREEGIPRSQMDTTLVYEAVFNKYGYDTDDYLFSVRNYLKDPERFAKIFEEVAKRLEGEVEVLDKIIEHEEWLARQLGAKRPQIDSILAPFSKDNIFVGLARTVRDTSRYAAWFRLEPVHEDTLMIPVDSLKTKKDSVVMDVPDVNEKAEPLRNPSIIQETRSRIPVQVVTEKSLKKEEVVKEEAE